MIVIGLLLIRTRNLLSGEIIARVSVISPAVEGRESYFIPLECLTAHIYLLRGGTKISLGFSLFWKIIKNSFFR